MQDQLEPTYDLTIATARILRRRNARDISRAEIFDVPYTYTRRTTYGQRIPGDIETVRIRGTFVRFVHEVESPWLLARVWKRYALVRGAIFDIDAVYKDEYSIGGVCFENEEGTETILSAGDDSAMLGVDASFQRHGIAAKLYELAIQYAPTLGLTLVPALEQSRAGRAVWARLLASGHELPAEFTERLKRPTIYVGP